MVSGINSSVLAVLATAGMMGGGLPAVAGQRRLPRSSVAPNFTDEEQAQYDALIEELKASAPTMNRKQRRIEARRRIRESRKTGG